MVSFSRRRFGGGVFAILLGRASRGEAAEESLAVIGHPLLRREVLPEHTVRAVFLRVLRTWPDSLPVVPFNLPTRTPARVAFDSAVVHMGPDEVAQFWVDKKIRGESVPPRQIATPALMIALVNRIPGAVGYVPEGFVKPGLNVLARVRDQRVVAP
jgi:hypothetical protein